MVIQALSIALKVEGWIVVLCVIVGIIGFGIQMKDIIKAWFDDSENDLSIKGFLIGATSLFTALSIVLATVSIGAFLSICFK